MGKQLTLPVRHKHKNIIPIAMDAAFFCERALKSLDKYDYQKAVRYFEKAIELEPNNPINHCNLAGTLSEMGRYEESNQYLYKVIEEITPDMAECFFYLANNYMNMENFELAEKYVLQYMDKSNEGEFIEEAEELLDLISLELGRAPRTEEKKENSADDLHDRAKQFIEEGSFVQAKNLLENLLQDHPDYLAAKNNLALSYYYMGEMDKGLKIIEQVLEEDNGNLHAMCNLAIFYSHTSSQKGLRKILDLLAKMIPMQYDEIFKLATTLGILGEHKPAYLLFRKLAKYTFYFDVHVLHYTAVAAFNLKKWKEARKWWEKAKLFTDEPLLDKFIQLSRLMEKEDVQDEELSYHFPESDMVTKDKKGFQFYDLIKTNPMIRSSFLWALKFGEKDTKLQVLQAISFLNDKESEESLRHFLLQPDQDENLKQIAVLLLYQMGAQPPFRSVIGERETDMFPPTKKAASFIQRWHGVMDCLEKYMGEHYTYEEHQEAHNIWIEFLSKTYPDLPQIRKKETWAAAVEYFVAKHNKKKVTQAEIADRYGISPTSLAQNYKKLNESIENTIE